ncbi:MAG TPA: hypothetical protein PLL45_12815 [Thermoflexales bacterium]|mgnify:FL=1|nr:hypothetical protein [Thermoflexales bacterium]
MTQANLPGHNAGQTARIAADPVVIRAALGGLRAEPVLSQAAIARITAAAIAAKQAQIAARRSETAWERLARRIRNLDASRLGGWVLPSVVAAAAIFFLGLAAYVAMGGSAGPGSVVASAPTPYEVRQRRSALFLSWQNASMVSGGETALGGGDVIVATQPVTITFPDGTIAVAQPGSELVVLVDRPGLELRRGEVETSIGGSARAGGDGAKFSLITRRGAYRDLGTVFRARTGIDEDFLATDQGLVQAGVRTRSGDLLSADVRAREELVVPNNVTKLDVQLQEPRAQIETAGGELVRPGGLSNSAKVTVTGVAFAGGQLEIAGGLAPIQTRVGPGGRFTVPLTVAEGAIRLSLTVRADDGRARSSDIVFMVDTMAPALSIAQRDAAAGKFGFSGKTEAGAVVIVNGVAAIVDSDGVFSGEIISPAGGVLTAVARDPAGNQTVAVIVVR